MLHGSSSPLVASPRLSHNFCEDSILRRAMPCSANYKIRGMPPTFRSLQREKIELTKGRAKQTENPLMKRLQPQDLGLPSWSGANVEEINSLKALKDPAHGWTVSRLVDLIRNGL